MTAVVVELPRREEGEPPRPSGSIRSGLARMAAVFAAERDRWVLWLPVFMGLGIAAYFLLPVEPPLIVALVLPSFAVAGAWLAAGPMRVLLVAPLIATWAGFFAADMRTSLVAAPVLDEEIGWTEIDGRVRWREPLEDGRLRIVLDDVRIADLVQEETPERIRLSLRGLAEWPGIGDRVRVAASLAPPGGPVAPGAYDFARVAWFERIGAVGYTGNTLTVIAPAVRASAGVGQWMARLRAGIQARISAALPPREAAMATALLIGARGGISQADNEAMRKAGIAHLIAISGLNLGLVAGLVFLVIRGALALIEPAALRWPIKKIAAVAALVVAALYLGISGGSVSAERSFIMLAVGIFAVLIDRPAITMRTVAFTAALILLVTPESLLNPSFQMSFGAVTGLVAAYEWLRDWRGEDEAHRFPRVAGYMLAVGLTTIISEIATSPFAAYHFNQFQIYGLVANEVAVPLLAFFVMPLGVLAVIAMPFGLEEWPLRAMGWGIDQMLAAAHFTADLPGAVRMLEAWPPLALTLMVAGGLWLCLWRKAWRLAGVPIALVGLALGIAAPGYDAFIGPEGDTLAFRARGDAGWDYGLIGVRATSYRGETWLKRLGGDPAQELAATARAKCDALGCIVPVGRGGELSLVTDGRALGEECIGAGIVVSAVRLPASCDGPHIALDYRDMRESGAAALILARGEPRVLFVHAGTGVRPWQRQAD